MRTKKRILFYGEAKTKKKTDKERILCKLTFRKQFQTTGSLNLGTGSREPDEYRIRMQRRNGKICFGKIYHFHPPAFLSSWRLSVFEKWFACSQKLKKS